VSKNLAGGDGHATVTGMMIGSPAYMSPEQIRMSKDVDHRTDIWSLGIILFELLTGTRPFVGMSEEIIRQILTAPIPTVSSRMRHVPPELDAIVTRCLSRNRDERYHDTKELARTLAAYAEINQVARRVVNVPAASESEADTLVAIPAPSQQREAPRTPAQRTYTAATNAWEDSSQAAFPTGTQILSPTDQLPSAMPPWRRQVQQALAANRQASEPLEGMLTPDPLQAAPTGENVALLTAAPVPHAKVPVLPTSQAQAPNAGKPPESSSSKVTAMTPARRVPVRLYAIIGVGGVTVAALVAVLVLRKGPSEAPPPPTSQPEEASVQVAEPPAIPASAITPAAAQTAPPILEPIPAPPSASVTSTPIISPPTPPTPPRPPSPRSTAASGAVKQLPPCTRFIKKNCQAGSPL
jgi:hypothetical protein